MVFSSLVFLFLFLPVVLILYYLTPRKFRNLTLLIADLVFYAWGEPVFVLLMIFSIVINYIAGILLGKYHDKKNLSKWILIADVAVNLGLLGFFKYAGLIGETLNIVLPFLNLPAIEVALPIGISFYTFQTMSYTIDVYRNTVKVQKNFIAFGTYVSLFPQLIAGPIVRYEDVAAQMLERRENLAQFTDGVKIFLVGLSKKILLANEMGSLWDFIRNYDGNIGVLGAWTGIIAYSFQLYFDFSGYSDMAVGLGKMFGFDFIKNFDYPYISKSITEFWRRWHISLGTWFREYVYIPLGGNRKGLGRQIINLGVVWFLTGLWHGASYNFILWGLYFGIILVMEKIFLLKLLKKAPAFIGHIYSLFIIILGWVLFYFEDMGKLWEYAAKMFGSQGFSMNESISVILLSYLPLLIAAAVASTPLVSMLYNKVRSKPVRYVLDNSGCIAALLLCTSKLVSSAYNPFLYFKF